ncbi:MAG TPA: CotS family spore coat protein [Firmicutes bacterium]|nr:CotS family spore coat protein [Bacillota bacterium]
MGRVNFVGKAEMELWRVLSKWPITPLSITSYKDVYRVEAVEGSFCLKEVDRRLSRVAALEGALIHFRTKGFTKTAAAHETKEGRLICRDEAGGNFILTDWLAGRKPSFGTSDEDIAAAAVTLAEFHQASEGYDPPPEGKLRNRLNRWPRRFSSFLRQLVELREQLEHKPLLDNFDRLFVEHYPWILDRAEDGWCVLSTSKYDDLVTAAQEARSFCHGDAAQRNFVIADDRGCCLIDFDLLRRDIRIADVYKLLRDVLKKRHWNFQAAQLLLDSYSSVAPLDGEEITVLYALLAYPRKIIHLILRYYIRRDGKASNWPARKFISKFQALAEQQLAVDRFLRDFRSEYSVGK